MQHDNEIRICAEHAYRVPLIWTMKFVGAEYWCPYCGYQSGMFGAGRIVKIPGTDLLKRQEAWQKLAKPFLSGQTDDWKYKQKINLK